MTPTQAVHAHRRQQATAGWPLLNACPNTFAVRRLWYLESLGAEEVDALLSDWEAYETEAAQDPRGPHALMEEVERFPAFASYLRDAQNPADQRSASTLPVKLVAGVMKEPALVTLDDWAQFLGLSPEAAHLRPPLAFRLEDLVPVSSKAIRAGLKKMMKARFGAGSGRIDSDHSHFEGAHEGCPVILDALFAAGFSKYSNQLSPYLSVSSPESGASLSGGYEALWNIPAQWDYLTEENWERSLTLLGDMGVVMADLVRGRAPEPSLTAARP